MKEDVATTPRPDTVEAKSAAVAVQDEGRVPRRVLVPLVVAVAVVGLIVIGKVTTPTFLTFRNGQNIIRSAAITGIVAVGMTFITISGSYFSLAAGETAAFVAIAFSAMLAWGWGWFLAVLLSLALAAGLGAVQGAVVAAGGNPIVTTLGAGAFLFGLSAVVTDNKTIRVGTDTAEWIGRGRPLGVPNQTWAFITLAVIAAVVLSRTRFGRTVNLVGANRAAAVSAGLRPGTVAVAVFVIASVAAGVAAVFTAAQIGQGVTDQFPELNIDAIAAILVGGTAVAGGEGSMIRTALGATFIASLNNLMLLREYSYGIRVLLEGLVIVAAVGLFAVMRRRLP